MEKIYIGFSYPKKFKIGAVGIAMWMNRPYSHVYIRFESSKLPSNVYHAANGMVHFREFENFKKENNIIKEYIIPLTSEARTKFLTKAVYMAGEKYSFIELAQIMGSDIAYNVLNKELKFKDAKGYICSELAGSLCSTELGIEFNRPLNLLKPSHVDMALEGKYELNR